MEGGAVDQKLQSVGRRTKVSGRAGSGEAAGISGSAQNSLRNRARFGSSVRQYFVDQVEIGGQFSPTSASAGKAVPVVFKKSLLQIAVSQSTGSQTVFE